MEHQFKTLEWFKESWPNYTKNRPFPAKSRDMHGYGIAFEVGELQILLGVVKGVRGGLYQSLFIVDPTQKVLADQLLCSGVDVTEEKLFGWTSFKINLGPKHIRFDEECAGYLERAMHTLQQNPASLRPLADLVGFGHPSVLTVTGGAVSPR